MEEVSLLKEEVKELTERLAKLEKIEKRRRDTKLIKIIIKVIVVLIVVFTVYRGYVFINKKVVEPYNTIMEKLDAPDELIETGKSKLENNKNNNEEIEEDEDNFDSDMFAKKDDIIED